MRVLITGCCGFVGSSLVAALRDIAASSGRPLEIYGIDNFSRAGSELNRRRVAGMARFFHGDLRNPSDLASIPPVDWVIDASANPSVLAGVDGSVSSRQIIEHNLLSTVNILEYCKRVGAGFLLLSTSRVYSIKALSGLRFRVSGEAFALDLAGDSPQGVTELGIDESFPTSPPVSLYGATKLASEVLALEYGSAFGLPVCINRCGVLAGPGQFGRADQGIVAFWVHSWLYSKPLKYIGFEGTGFQVRDCLHVGDLAQLVSHQLNQPPSDENQIFNVGGGPDVCFSLAELSARCAERFGDRAVEASKESRQFDIPWMIMDSRLVQRTWAWRPETSFDVIFDEIADHARREPNWLEMSAGT